MVLKKNFVRSVLFFTICLLVPSMALAGTQMTLPTVVDPGYRIQALMPKTQVNGFNGIAFDSLGTLYGGVVQSSTTYKIDKESGELTPYILPPYGGADDLIFEPGGRVIWTAFFLGKVFARGADGKILTLAENLPGANAIARSQDGRVFFYPGLYGGCALGTRSVGKDEQPQNCRKPGRIECIQGSQPVLPGKPF